MTDSGSATGVDADQLLSVADVAAHIGCNEKTVRGWIRSGELKAESYGSRIGYRVRRADYEEYRRRRTLTGAITRELLRAVDAA